MQLHVQLLLTGADSGQLTTARKQWSILIIPHGIQVSVVPHHHPRSCVMAMDNIHVRVFIIYAHGTLTECVFSECFLRVACSEWLIKRAVTFPPASQ